MLLTESTVDPFTTLTLALSRNTLSNNDKHVAICRCVKSVIPNASRVSLWKFKQDRTALDCLVLQDHDEVIIPDEVVLKASDFPDYFEAILQNQWVVASDARNHAVTRCFNESYFEPNQIYSLMDYSFQDFFKAVGVICCEATGQPVVWTNQDIAGLKRIAGITSMFFKE